MDSLKLQNYRCFENTGWINLKSINLLVGANSSGKSSILKFFPLLKQSEGVKLHGVFKWFGKDVDFKDFHNTVQDGKNEITVDYSINDLILFQRFSRQRKGAQDVSVSFKISAVDCHFDMVKNINISYLGTDIRIGYTVNQEASVYVNGVRSDGFPGLKLEWTLIDATFPRILFKYKNEGQSLFCNFLYKKIINESISLGGQFRDNPKSLFFDRYPSSFENFKKGLYGIVGREIEESKVSNLYTLCILYNINQLIDSLNLHLISLSSRIVYIKPIRATIERYYRFQNIDLDDIDADGNNLPMFLYNLDKGKLEKYNDWLQELFNFKIQIKSSEGHIELLVAEKGKAVRNMVDLGFGYTQILPILTVIWKNIFLETDLSSRVFGSKNEYIIVIEQPELHLHPHIQGKFAKMLSLILSKGLNVKFIIETHSETILNKLGVYIEKGLLKKENVNVLMIEQNDKGVSIIRQTEYTEEGYLQDWPRNFMDDVD